MSSFASGDSRSSKKVSQFRGRRTIAPGPDDEDEVLLVKHIGNKKKIMTKTVHRDWYRRYAYVLPEDERVYEQPASEVKLDLLTEIQINSPPPKEASENIQQMVKKVQAENEARLNCIMMYVEGKEEKAKEQLDKMKLQKKWSLAQKALRPELHDVVKKVQSLLRIGRQYKKKNSAQLVSKWRVFHENKIVQEKLQKMIDNQRANKTIHRWCTAISTIRAALRFWNIVNEIAATTSVIFDEITAKSKDLTAEYKNTNAMFDKSYYARPLQASKEFGQSVIMTLRDHAELRTDKDVLDAAVALRCLKSFGIFPLSHQMIMAKIGQYIEIPADKVIIRQGQPPQYIYFVLSGRAIAMKMVGSRVDGENGKFELVDTFEEGAVIGDDGLYDCEYRPYSVSSVTKCQILSINIDDHIQITRVPKVPNENPDHIKFLSQLDIMLHFPLNKLMETDQWSRNIMLFYFHPGKIITRRKNKSKYVFFVKTGYCQVIAEMTTSEFEEEPPRVKFDETKAPEVETDGTKEPSKKQSILASSSRSKVNSYFNPASKDNLKDLNKKDKKVSYFDIDASEDVNANKRILPQIVPNHQQLNRPCSYRDFNSQNTQDERPSICSSPGRAAIPSGSAVLCNTPLPDIRNTNASSQRNVNSSHNDSLDVDASIEPKKPTPNDRRKSSLATPNNPRKSSLLPTRSSTIGIPKVSATASPDNPRKWSMLPTPRRSTETTPVRITSSTTPRRSALTPTKRMSVSADKFVQKVPSQTVPNVSENKMWVFLKQISTGDVFGIEDLNCGDGLKVGHDIALISEGSEIVMVRKKFIEDNMSPKMAEHIRSMGKHHPDHSTIIKRLANDHYWRRFKKDVQTDRKRD